MWLGIKGHRKKGLGIKWQEDKIFSLGIWFCKNEEEDEYLNVGKAVEKCCKTLEKWSHRKLSLKGRITVIKSYAMPKLLYVLNNVHVPEVYIKKVNDTFFKYLWEDKPDKVKRATVIQDYELGGLKMINFEYMCKSMKAMWIKRMMINMEANWLLFIKSAIDISLEDLIKCNYSKKTIPGNFTKFYHQVFSSWAEIIGPTLNFNDPWCIRRQPIYYNKYILAGGKYYNEQWNSSIYNSNIKIVHDICNADGTIMSKIQLEDRYNTRIGAMEYNSLVTSIPKQWKTVLKSQMIPRGAINTQETLHIRLNTIDRNISELKNKELYRLLLKQAHQPAIRYIDRWEGEFGMGINWKKHFNTTKIERQAKIHSFQYSIVHGFFPCNLYLSKWKDDVSPLCISCPEIDDICHYFFRCGQLSDFWQACEVWLNDSLADLEEMLTLQCKDVILGVLEPKRQAEVMNFIILQAKWYIFRKKLNGENIVFKEFQNRFYNRMQIEEYLYRIKYKIDVFHEIFSNVCEVK